MESRETLGKEELRAFFRMLKNRRSFIRIEIPGQELSCHTRFLAVQDKEKPFLFQIDSPCHLAEALKKNGRCKIHFESLGEDKAIYRFTIPGGKVSKGIASFTFPETIERIQRRERFRIKAPPSCKMILPGKARCREFSVINLSESGILVEMDGDSETGPFFQMESYVEKPVIQFSEADIHKQVAIKGALVKRIEKNPGSGRYRFGLQFTGLQPATEKELRDLVYRLQRNYLKTRQIEVD